MANLNLSEFGEKLFVADADHTFIWDTAASISKRVSRNSWLNSGTLTSDAPVTISQTWNDLPTVFTAFKVNAAGSSDANSASGSLLADFQLNGVSKFKVGKSGVATLSADGVPQLRMISVTGSGSVFNGLTLESSLSTLAGFLVNRSTGEVKIGGLSNAGYFPTFYSNNAERMRITTAGNVGIGTTDPDNALTVRSTTNNVNGVGQLILLSSDALAADKGGRFGLAGIYDNVNGRALFAEVAGLKENATSGNWAGYLTLRTRAAGGAITDRLRIDSAGNVGIGTTSPTSKLQVSAGDVEVDTIAKGVILKSPDGTRYRVTVANGGTLSVAAA